MTAAVEAVRTEDVALTATGHDFVVRVYRPAAAGSEALVWVHGGAWIGGSIDMPEADWVARMIAAEQITVVSVDYTLAPPPQGWTAEPDPGAGQRPRAGYPVASLQVVAAFDWALRNAGDLGVDPARIGLGGASAGGNLAAGAALRLRDAGGARPHAVILIYPAVHRELPAGSPALVERLAALPDEDVIDPAEMPRLVASYAGDAAGEAYAFPGGHDAAGLPRTLIVNADLDTLRPSGEAYAAELARAGGDVRVLTEIDSRHGYLNEPQDPAAALTIDRMVAWLRE